MIVSLVFLYVAISWIGFMIIVLVIVNLLAVQHYTIESLFSLMLSVNLNAISLLLRIVCVFDDSLFTF